jgi:hypothetical protein
VDQERKGLCVAKERNESDVVAELIIKNLTKRNTMTKKPITFQEWYDDNEVNGIATFDLKYRVDISSEVESELDEDAAIALTKEGISDIPFHTVEYEYKDFLMDITVEIAIKKLSDGKIKAFVNSVEAA